jgi:dTMP kinase
MNKFYALIAVLIILALAGFGLFFSNKAKMAEQDALMQEQISQLNDEQQKLMEIEKGLREEKAQSEALARQADEARLMAEAQAEKERQERERLVAELNERLAREAIERKEAEEAQLALAAKMKELEAAQAEAQAALAALEAEQVDTSGSDAADLKAKLQEQEQALVALSSENEALKDRQQLLEQQQMATEEAIISAGGRIAIPYPEIRSPNARRQSAIYFKERILGHKDGK